MVKLLNDIIRKCFRKIRLGKTIQNEELENLFEHKEEVLTNINQTDKDEIEKVEEMKADLDETVDKIASICPTRNKELYMNILVKLKIHLKGFPK